MDLVRQARRPELRIDLGGQTYAFSELTIGDLADLQAWIAASTPPPLPDIDDHIDEIWPGFRDRLMKHANVVMSKWPPQIGTPAAAAIFDTTRGQTELFHRALLIHQPGATCEEARAVWSGLRRRGDLDYLRVIHVLFGVAPPPRYPQVVKTLRRNAAGPESSVDWETVFRAAAQRLKFTAEETCRHTHSQIAAMLTVDDPDERGRTSFNSFEELHRQFGIE